MRAERRERFLIVIATACLGMLAGDRLLLSPLHGLWASRSRRIVELERRIQEGQVLLDRKEALGDRWESMVVQALPSEPSLAEDTALRCVDRWAEGSGFRLTSLRPQWVYPEDPGPGFAELRFGATGHGNMESIARFLFELERGEISLKLLDVELGSRGNGGNDLGLDVQFSVLVAAGENG